ncbi:MAG: glycosyltransferase family 1 protein [Ferruginibacter sp.]|nr:glycosyltransferase family 1 protein [Ferruginibacter sp.]
MDLICFSHLRWNFVYQRPQHLLTRFAGSYRVFYVEEPLFTSDPKGGLSIRKVAAQLWVITPELAQGLSPKEIVTAQQELLVALFDQFSIHPDIFWYYTPMALPFTKGFAPELTVYDCMDELSNFKFAPPELKTLEADLFRKADVVFTGGHNLFSAKKNSHANIWPVPSSIEKEHFAMARTCKECPADQALIPGPRFGYYGVIDERMDINLIREVAEQRPDWHFVMLGPVIKIDPACLPQLPNVHFLGGKSYAELPLYLGGWDIAMVPFELNDSTKYISPTKTPEYLSGGVPVISTAIVDVVHPYGTKQLVHIVGNATEFIEAAQKELACTDRIAWLKKVDEFIKDDSWDNTYKHMSRVIDKTRKGFQQQTTLTQPQNNVIHV